MSANRLDELCASCGMTFAGHIGNPGCVFPCWTPSGRFAPVPSAPAPCETCGKCGQPKNHPHHDADRWPGRISTNHPYHGFVPRNEMTLDDLTSYRPPAAPAPEATREADEATDWMAWKRHLIVCAACTAGVVCAEGDGILGDSTPDDAPWLKNVPAEPDEARVDAALFAFCEELSPVLWPEMNVPGHHVYAAPRTTMEEVKRLVATVAAQAREIETLRADKARLDWLERRATEQNVVLTGLEPNGDVGVWGVALEHGGGCDEWEDWCLRAAIDKALAARAPEATT